MASAQDLNQLLDFLKVNYPMPRTSKPYISFIDAPSIYSGTALSTTVPALANVRGLYTPLSPTRSFPYTGMLDVALQGDDPLNTLAHEYCHVLQDADGTLTEEYRWDNECEAITFARITLAEYQNAQKLVKN